MSITTSDENKVKSLNSHVATTDCERDYPVGAAMRAQPDRGVMTICKYNLFSIMCLNVGGRSSIIWC